MRSFQAVLALLIMWLGIVTAAPIKRDIQYVVATTTVEMQYSQYAALQTAAQTTAAITTLALVTTSPQEPTVVETSAVATTAAAATTSASSSLGSLWLRLQQLFGIGGGSSSSAAATTSAAVASTGSVVTNAEGLATVVATQVVYITASSSGATVLASGSSAFSTSRTQAQVVSQPAPGGATASSTAETSTSTGFSWNSLFGGGSGSSSSNSSSSSGGSISIDSSQKVAQQAKGISYSPYTKSGSCKSLSDVTHDFQILQYYSEIRLYSTDCSAIENLLLLMSSGQSLFLGIYNIDSDTITNGLQTIKTAVEGSSKGWSAVNTISIGNERVNNGWSTVSDLQTAVDTAKSWIKSNAPDYTGPVVTVDTLVATVSNPGLCDVSDYIAVNCHPFWDGGVDPSNAGPWLQQQILNLEKVCGTDKKILITETGWPTQGDTFGSCVPSQQNQNSAISSINGVLADQVYMFTTYNDYWKEPGPSNVERYWGIYGDPES